MLIERFTPDNYPLVVLARTGNPLIDGGWDSSITTVIHCVADPYLVNDRRMPQHTDRIYPIEEGIARELEAFNVGALHVASVTGDGERRIIYLHTSPLNFDPILTLFKAEGYELKASSSPNPTDIRELVIPTKLDHQLSGDLGVISNIGEHGDDGLVPRKTDFWFYGDIPSLRALAGDLEPWGFSVDHWLDEPVGVVLTCETKVDFETFKDLTPILVSQAERHDLDYDGWETFVIKPESEMIEQPKAPKQSLLSKLFGAKKN